MVLETQKIRLREFTGSDAEAVYWLNNDTEVLKYTGDLPFQNISEARSFLENYDHYQKFGFGRWAVLQISTGEFPGWCGRKYEGNLSEYDLGYRFAKQYWNKAMQQKPVLDVLLMDSANWG